MTIRTLRRVILVAGAVVLVAAGCTTGEWTVRPPQRATPAPA